MKKMSFCSAIVLLLSFYLGGCSQPQPNPKLDDLNLLCETLETEHYDLYANVSEEEFQDEREKIARQTPNMTDAEFYWSVRHLLSLVGDAHTTVYPRDYFMSVLPWNIKKFDEGWFILILDKAHEQYLGTRVVAINDVPIDEVVERTRQVISYETDSWFWNLVPQTLAWRGALEYLEIVKEGEPVTVTVEMQDGAEQSFELTATDDWDERSQMVSFQREAIPETGYQSQSYYWSTELDEDTYFIQYNVCAGGDPSMPEFAQQVQADLESGYQNIIFDLRYNNGGNDQIILPLKNAVVNARNKQGEKCHLYVLTGWNTFSAGVDAAAGFQTSNAENTTFVGQPTGGSLQTGGNLLEISMDSVPFAVTCALDYFVILGQTGSLVPDYIVPQTFEQYAKGEDAEIQYLYDNLL